jgi:cytochrome c
MKRVASNHSASNRVANRSPIARRPAAVVCSRFKLLRYALAAVLLLGLGCLASSPNAMGRTPVDAAADDDDENPFSGGLLADYRDSAGHAWRRLDATPSWATASLHAHPNASSRLLTPGPIKVEWRGLLEVQTETVHRLAVFGAGHAIVRLDGKVVLTLRSTQPQWSVSEPLPLAFHRYPLAIDYETPAVPQTTATRATASNQTSDHQTTANHNSDPPRFALYWSSDQFPLEPIAARHFQHERATNAKTVAETTLIERGHELVRALRCDACHRWDGKKSDEPVSAEARTPTASTTRSWIAAPSLEKLGGSMHADWLRHHLSTQPPTAPATDTAQLARRMPYFALSDSEVADLAAYLLSSSSELDRPVPPAAAPEPSNRSDKASKASTSEKAEKTGKAGKAGTTVAAPRAPDAAQGRVLLRTVGCLACHLHDGLGTADLFGGGDLSAIGEKWKPAFFPRWLADPHSLRSEQRMPVFELSNVERDDLTAALVESRAKESRAKEAQSVAGAATDGSATPPLPPSDARHGAKLFTSLGCAACHLGPTGQPAVTNSSKPQPVGEGDSVGTAPAFDAAMRWGNACTGGFDPQRRRPAYHLSSEAVRAVQAAVRDPGPATRNRLRENNCLQCHARDTGVGLAPVAQAVVARDAELAPLLPALVPPSLTGVGDKLRDEALDAAIRRLGPARRPWLSVRMPRFSLSAADATAVAGQLIDADRVPPAPPAEVRASRVLPLEQLSIGELELRSIAGRLVTPDGFGCTSCHPAGGVQPPPAPLNARGPDLTRLGDRIRAEWYDRWVRAPARMVPRMEMPSVQIPVRGVLGERLDAQLAAVWHGLHLPDFRPPEPNPVRILRLTGDPARRERAIVVSDVVQAEGRTWIKPLLIGLPHRHNLVFDFETNRLARWSLGDLARQRTKGKSWHWEAAGVDLWGPGAATLDAASELLWEVAGERRTPPLRGQFPSEPEWWRLTERGVEFAQRLRFQAPAQTEPASGQEVLVVQSFEPIGFGETPEGQRESGFRRTISVRTVQPLPAQPLPAQPLPAQPLPANVESTDEAQRPSKAKSSENPTALERAGSWRFRLAGEPFVKTLRQDVSRRELKRDDGGLRLVVATPGVTWDADGTCRVPAPEGENGGVLVIEYRTALTNDRFVPLPVAALPAPAVEALSVAPGFIGSRLPLDDAHMPTALAWRPDGTLVIASLKGQLLEARDSDGDGLEDRLSVFADGLAAPYGVAAAVAAARPLKASAASTAGSANTAAHVIDVATKTAVLRLWDEDGDRRADRIETVASGWGHTDDYHDWTVGLPSDGQGGYFVGLGCQQDKRSVEAARWRGTVLRLAAPRGGVPPGGRFQVEAVSGGHRFPMGLARNRAGQLFATDNQGNFNPFNELNHVRPGLRFGFLNTVERRPDFQPPTEPPAIEIPHPWTRSVNGICFLEADGSRPFGPFTGHLVGCEYDTRRLVRMSLQPIGDTFQGAVYPLTYDQPRSDPWLLGPICCAVAPNGDLVVGGIRDSGWGGGNNLGEVVRLRFAADRLPAGIAEVRAVRDGFVLDFTHALERSRLEDAANFTIVSYRRESTSAYGGPDLQRRDETVRGLVAAADGRSVRVKLDAPRLGFVYEFRARNLVADGTPFHPAEAYFTLRQIVDRE